MSRVYKSARGKMIDMDAVKLANEDTIAVGNMKVNARGDKLGPGGRVDTGRNEIMDRVYSVNTASTNTGYSPNDPAVYAEREAMMDQSKAKKLHDLAANLISVVPEEAAAPAVPEVAESTDAPAPSTRGSLASSVAKTKVVTQELMVDPRKPKGPTRI
jgi:hypothetical protein